MVLFSSGTSVGVKSLVSVLVPVPVAFVAAVLLVFEVAFVSAPVVTELVSSVVPVFPPGVFVESEVAV